MKKIENIEKSLQCCLMLFDHIDYKVSKKDVLEDHYNYCKQYQQNCFKTSHFLCSLLFKTTYTACPKKDPLLPVEADISGLKATIGKNKTSFENNVFHLSTRSSQLHSSITEKIGF